MTEEGVKEYIVQAKKGSLLAEKYCKGYPSTSYFVLSRSREDLGAKIASIQAYQSYYGDGVFRDSMVAQLTRNPKIVKKIVIYTLAEWVDICGKMAGDEIEVIPLSGEDCAALQAYSRLGKDSHKNLFPQDPIQKVGYKQTSYVWNPIIYGEWVPSPVLCEKIYGVSPYEMSLYLPVDPQAMKKLEEADEKSGTKGQNTKENSSPESEADCREKLDYRARRDLATLSQVEDGFYLTAKHCPTEENTIYLLCNRHIGDVFLFLKCVNPIKYFYSKENKMRQQMLQELAPELEGNTPRTIEKVVVLTTRVLSGVAKLYSDVEEIRVLPASEIQAMKMYAHTLCPHQPYIFGDAMNWIDPYMQRELYGTYELLYGLPIPPVIREQEQSVSKLSEDSLADTKQWLQDQGIEVSRMVLIAPYAQTSTSLTPEDCKPLIDYCHQQNYQVFTNCSPMELPLDGTEKAVLPLDICCGLCALGCKVVGTQSGFVDTLRWLGEPKLSLLVVLQSLLLCEKDWAMEWNLTERLTKLSETTYFLVGEESKDLGESLLDVFLKWQQEEEGTKK